MDGVFYRSDSALFAVCAYLTDGLSIAVSAFHFPSLCAYQGADEICAFPRLRSFRFRDNYPFPAHSKATDNAGDNASTFAHFVSDREVSYEYYNLSGKQHGK